MTVFSFRTMRVFFPIFLLVAVVMTACSKAPQPETEPAELPRVDGMVLIPGGRFSMGGDAGKMDGGSQSHQTAYPIHEVEVDAFWIDATEVTNRQFAEFVEATGYLTFAERPLPESTVAELRSAAEFNLNRMRRSLPYVTGRDRVALEDSIARVEEAAATIHLNGAIVFAGPESELHDPTDVTQWWRLVPGTTWRTPDGPGTSWEDRLDHPVVNVTHEDAAAYAAWAGKRLPTEAEWERAARAGMNRQPFGWGREMFPRGDGVWMANIWQGPWPFENTGEDGYLTTAPVKQFPPNGYGLYDMAGNVWEIVADVYHPHTYKMRSALERNPTGPPLDLVQRPGQRLIYRVTRGGSFLCSDSWCSGYQPGSRQSLDNESPSNHTGFRCARDA